MKVISWNVNGLRARMEDVNRLVADLEPVIKCFQKVRTKRDFLILALN